MLLTQNDTSKEIYVRKKKYFLIYFSIHVSCVNNITMRDLAKINRHRVFDPIEKGRKKVASYLGHIWKQIYLKFVPDCWSSFNIWSIIPLCNILGDLSMKEKIETARTLEAGILDI